MFSRLQLPCILVVLEEIIYESTYHLTYKVHMPRKVGDNLANLAWAFLQETRNPKLVFVLFSNILAFESSDHQGIASCKASGFELGNSL